MKTWNLSTEAKRFGDQIWDLLKGSLNGESLLEQLSYLLLIRDLDQRATREERKSQRLGSAIEDTISRQLLEDPHLRWSRFKNLAADDMFRDINECLFPFLRSLEPTDIFKEARFGIVDAALLIRVVDIIAQLPWEKPSLGEFYEYLVDKLPSPPKKQKYKLRTPRHIIELMVALLSPSASDQICDPCCGTGGFLIGVSDFFQREKTQEILDPKKREHLLKHMLKGYDCNRVSLLFAYTNLLFHGIEKPKLELRDSLADSFAKESELYDLILSNPPFKAPLDEESRAQNLANTTKTELLFSALCLRLLKPGGRSALIVPDGVLFGDSRIHKALKRSLVEEHKLEAVVSLPSEVFKPHSGVSAAILIFTRTDSGGTDHVWFYGLEADGWSLDDKRAPLLEQDKLGCRSKLTEDEHEKNNLPDVLARWEERSSRELERPRTAQSFSVNKNDIVAKDYDLSMNRYRDFETQDQNYRLPEEILKTLDSLEVQIKEQKQQLKELLARD